MAASASELVQSSERQIGNGGHKQNNFNWFHNIH